MWNESLHMCFGCCILILNAMLFIESCKNQNGYFIKGEFSENILLPSLILSLNGTLVSIYENEFFTYVQDRSTIVLIVIKFTS